MARSGRGLRGRSPAGGRVADPGSRMLWRLVPGGACLGAALALSVHHPWAIVLAAGAGLWVLWPAYAGGGRLAEPVGTTLRVRYVGGHPDLPVPGLGWLVSWPRDGAAVLRVGGSAVAFPLAAVQAVALSDGRAEVPTGCTGPCARLVGRLRARGLGRFCGLRRRGRQDVAVVDRSRVVCDVARQHSHCRIVLTGPKGGGEDIYLETLVMLRPAGARGAGAPGGPRSPGVTGGWT